MPILLCLQLRPFWVMNHDDAGGVAVRQHAALPLVPLLRCQVAPAAAEAYGLREDIAQPGAGAGAGGQAGDTAPRRLAQPLLATACQQTLHHSAECCRSSRPDVHQHGSMRVLGEQDLDVQIWATVPVQDASEC